MQININKIKSIETYSTNSLNTSIYTTLVNKWSEHWPVTPQSSGCLYTRSMTAHISYLHTLSQALDHESLKDFNALHTPEMRPRSLPVIL